jgi:3-polyprenyl-4-hydroxybenzoate decarboxylase
MTTRNRRVLLGITGSVAAVKGPELSLRLLEQGFDVKVLLTSGGSNFWDKAEDYNCEIWQALQKSLKSDKVSIHCKSDTTMDASSTSYIISLDRGQIFGSAQRRVAGVGSYGRPRAPH